MPATALMSGCLVSHILIDEALNTYHDMASAIADSNLPSIKNWLGVFSQMVLKTALSIPWISEDSTKNDLFEIR